MSAGDAESAAVLTPYNGQVRLIRGILKSKGGDLLSKARSRHRTLCPPASFLTQHRVLQHACMTFAGLVGET